MTTIDLAVILAGAFIAVLIYRQRCLFRVSVSTKYLFVIGLGALLIAGFYSADLITMWVMPHFIGMKAAMAAMEYLYLNVSWIAIPVGYSAVALGLALSMRSNADLIGTLKSNEKDLIENIAKLEKTERLYRDLILHSQFGIRIEHPGGQRVFANQTCATMFGYESPAQYLADQGKPGQRIAPHDRERLLKIMMARKQGHAALNEYDYDALKKDGSILPVQVFVRDIVWEGKPALLRTFIDISNRRAAENEAREIQDQYRRLIETLPDAIYVQMEGKIQYANPAVCDVFGATSPDQLVGISSIELFAPEHHADLKERRQQAVANLGPLPMIDAKRRRLDGGEFYGLSSGTHIQWNGKPAILVAVRDITDRKKTEELLAKAKEEAEAASRSKSQFLATMSHEIRTPMNGVLGMADLLARTELTATQRDYLKTLRESGGSLLDLLNDILDLSKIEAGRMDVETMDFSVAELLATTNALWAHSARGKGLLLAIHNNLTDIDIIRGDRTRTRQVLNNFIGNAIKFTKDGTIEVHANAVPRRDGRLALRFDVRDTGIGIPENQREKVFNPFTQADSSTTRQYGGTGLGLAISKTLVDLLGGEIGVESVEGKGSTFWFTVPVDQGSVDRIQPTLAPADPVVPADIAQDRSLRLLIAEDNPVNQQVVLHMVAPLNAQTHLVENGLEAIAAITRSVYDVVLMDIQMPEMDGVTATKKIRALAGPKGQIPIIAITANAMRGDREKYLDAGMNAYVAKPIVERELLSAIARCADIAMPQIDETAAAANLAGELPDQPMSKEAAEDIHDFLDGLDSLLDGTNQ